MVESIIWYFSTLGSAALFFFIGVYAEKREKPMWFWSGTEVKASEITNVRQYNKENGLMCAGSMFNIYHVNPHETHNRIRVTNASWLLPEVPVYRIEGTWYIKNG